MKTVLLDMETTAIGPHGELPKRVHLTRTHEYETGERMSFYEGDVEALEDYLSDADIVAAHNGLGFDFIVMKEVLGIDISARKVDTLVLSYMFEGNVDKEIDEERIEKDALKPNWHKKKFPAKLKGSHSLEAWGLRLGKEKGDYAEVMENKGIDPWAELNPLMETYCDGDVDILLLLWERFLPHLNNPDFEYAIELEHEMQILMAELKRNGMYFNMEEAEKLLKELEEAIPVVEEDVQKAFPPRFEPVRWIKMNDPAVTRPFFAELKRKEQELADAKRVYEIEKKRDKRHPMNFPKMEALHGRLMRQVAEMREQAKTYREVDAKFEPYKQFFDDSFYSVRGVGEVVYPKRNMYERKTKTQRTAGVPFTKIHFTALNHNSRPQLIRRFLEMGWVPSKFTDKGNPKLDEDALLELKEDFPAAASIIDNFLLKKRISQMATGEKAWMKMVDENNMIHPTIRPCATITHRATHANPNMSQVPALQFQKKKDEDGNVILDEKGKEVIEIAKGRAGGWGYECRALFGPPPAEMTGGVQWVQVGSDLSGLELRCFGDSLYPYDHGNFIEVLKTDVHAHNQALMRLANRTDAKRVIFACVPMDTQALTREGWKTYEQLRVGEDLLTYNADKKVKEWKPLLEKVYYDKAPLVRMKVGKFDVRCTPNHRWFVQRRTGNKHRRHYVDEVCTAENMSTECRIITNAPMSCEEDTTNREYPWLVAMKGEFVREESQHEEPVWCVRTENESWVMRQGDTITITGNTLYGAGDRKIGSLLLPSATYDQQMKRGREVRGLMMSGIEGFAQLNDHLRAQAKARNKLTIIDGRDIPVRNDYAALNTRLQSMGSILAKVWITETIATLEQDHGLKCGYDGDYVLMLWSHDEMQFAVHPDKAELVSEVCESAAIVAGESLDFKPELLAESKIGKNWAECH